LGLEVVELRPYQVEAIEATRRAAAQGSVILQLPTGSGKTVIAGDIVKRALAKGKRVAFLVPYISLIDQTWQSFYKQGIKDIGVIQADHQLYDLDATCQVCSVETLSRRKIYPDVDLVIVDEAHRRSAFVLHWMKMGATFVGLTATPWAVGMGNHWKSLIVGKSTLEMINEGYLSDFRVFAPSTPDLEGIKTVAGEYHQGQLYKRVANTTLIASIVDTWIEKSSHEKTLLFAVNRAHAAEIQARFLERGIAAGYIDAHTPPDERESIRKDFHSGRTKVVCNVGCLVAGVDWDVRTLILAAPTKSEIKYVQMVGRSLRTADGKAYSLILDHSDTTHRLGFVTDILHDKLNHGTKKKQPLKEKPEPNPCPKCGALKTSSICPHCGYRYIPESKVENEKGELVEVKKVKELKKEYCKEARLEAYAMFLHFAKRRGFKEGWAYHKTKELTGAYPCQKVPLIPPNEEVKKFIKNQTSKWSREKKKLSGGRDSEKQMPLPMK
jgi:superfamily II DNA or RNA helicase